MAHRQFVDARGRLWDVWEVHPAAGQDPAPVAAAQRKSPLVQHQLASGWLCFETAGLKRRLAPVPPGWAELGDEGLASLCARADIVPARRGAGTGTEQPQATL